MRSLLVTGEFPGIPGGVGDYSLQLGRALVERGCSVSVVTSADHRVREAAPLEVRACVTSWGLGGLRGLLRGCRESAPDCIALQYVPHMYEPHGLPLALPFSVSLLRARVKAPLVLVCHEPFIFLGGGRHAAAAAIQKALLRYLAALASSVVVTSDARARATARACRIDARKIRVIRVGSSLPALGPRRTTEPRDGRFQIVLFGSLDFVRRRPDVVCEAVARLSRTHPDVRFEMRLVGALPENTRRFLETLGETPYRVSPRGRLSAEDVASELAAADAAVLFDTHQLGGVSSRSAACAALLAAGVPTVCNRGADTDPIFEGETNVLFSEIAVPDLERQLERLLCDPSLGRRLSDGARALSEREFSWPRIARAFHELFQEALEPD